MSERWPRYEKRDGTAYRVWEDAEKELGAGELVLFSDLEAAEAENERLRDVLELLLFAVMPLLPVEGSWDSSFRISERIDPTLRATVEEWATAAHHFGEAHAALRAEETEQ